VHQHDRERPRDLFGRFPFREHRPALIGQPVLGHALTRNPEMSATGCPRGSCQLLSLLLFMTSCRVIDIDLLGRPVRSSPAGQHFMSERQPLGCDHQRDHQLWTIWPFVAAVAVAARVAVRQIRCVDLEMILFRFRISPRCLTLSFAPE
jgi:hypothetical protein